MYGGIVAMFVIVVAVVLDEVRNRKRNRGKWSRIPPCIRRKEWK